MLQLKNINKRFGSKTVAQDINLNVEAGEILAVLGRSGCGKSTLLKTIVGLVRPDSGEVWLNGDNITDMPSEKRNISLMFQDYALCRICPPSKTSASASKCAVCPKPKSKNNPCRPCATSVWNTKRNANPKASPAANSNASPSRAP